MRLVRVASVLLVVSLLVFVLPFSYAQDTAEDGLAPRMVTGTYETTYYAEFSDWQVFPVLLPMLSADNHLPFYQRFDLRAEAQIVGQINGEVGSGVYQIILPDSPVEAGWYDTDGDPNTPSKVKVFTIGTGTGMVGENYVSRYDFIYTRSFGFNPNNHLWSGKLLVWAAEENATFPVLNGVDNIYYTPDDIYVKVPAGWSVIEVKAKSSVGSESVRVFRTSQPVVELTEPTYLGDVDLSELSYEDAFLSLINHLEATYVFTDYRRVNWNEIRTIYGPKAAKVSSDSEFHALLETALFSFYDGHLAIIGPGIPEWFWGWVGMQVFPVEDQLMVMKVYEVSPIAQNTHIVPGTVITHVNGMDAMSYFASVPRTIYSSGHDTGDTWRRGSMAFRGLPGTVYDLTYRLPDGSEETTRVETVYVGDIESTETIDPRPLDYEILPNNIGFIAIRNFTSATLDNLWDAALETMLQKNVSGIIIDLRHNGGGFSTLSNYMLGSFLDSDVYAGREVSALDEDGDGERDIEDDFYYGRGRIFDPSRVVVLIGPDCFSACEFAAYAFKDIGAQVIGHLTSGGAGGGVGATYHLPGGTMVYGMGVVMSEDLDGNIIIEGIGVPLDVQVPFSAEALAAGEDTLLLTAISLLTD
ncbi:MAG: hypothetical protein KJ064_25215 [Anaerolineae bacterium]|nr:hypothetical protein [Anaerolineae bacterium]